MFFVISIFSPFASFYFYNLYLDRLVTSLVWYQVIEGHVEAKIKCVVNNVIVFMIIIKK
jgi:hypothetical protein